MAKLSIENFGPIERCDINLNDFTILIGRQASGKSTIAKLVYFFKSIPLWIAGYKDENIREQYIIREFNKYLKSKFIALFGPVFHEPFMEITYYFNESEDRWVGISQRPGKDDYKSYINIRFDRTTRDEVLHLLLRVNGYEKNSEKHISFLSAKIKDFDEFERKSFYDEASKIFNSKNTPVFVPAGRSLLTLLSGQIVKNITLPDFITEDFLKAIQRISSQVSGGLEAAERTFRQINRAPDRAIAAKARNLIKSVLNGEYKQSDGEERIYHSGNKYTKLSVSSSGQQESLWILAMVYVLIIERQSAFAIFEEPEAHLFPEAQYNIVKLLVLFKNYVNNSQIMITTHSPYILTSINNLIAGNISGKVDATKTDKIIDRAFWLPEEKVSAYFLNDGKVKDIFDYELNMIKAEAIDEVSETIRSEYDRLLEIKYDAR